ncbi:24614_t:CDS:2, partial [Entrophospora sp. SA101]
DEEVKRLYEELEEEVVEEEKQKGLINKWFRDFAKNISIRSGITIDTFRDIKFSRNPFKNQVLLQPTTNCLVHLINLSFLVITMADVEVVNLERIQYGLKNFDMVLIFKDYSHPLVHINTIPMSQLEGVKSWLDSIGIVYYEGTLNLNWTQIVRNINKDPAGFYTNGGLSFLDMDGKDDDDLEVSSDSASEFKLTESEEEDSEAKESVSASELEEESDESVLSQDELKERAPKVDKKIQDIKRKNSNDVHGSRGLQELESKKSYRLTNNDPINYRFNKFLGKAAGTIFALSLLIAGQVQHFAATIAGQVVQAMMEELISWKNVRPWTQDGFNSMLVASQVALSIQLPFAVIPLIYFTSKKIDIRKVDTNFKQ